MRDLAFVSVGPKEIRSMPNAMFPCFILRSTLGCPPTARALATFATLCIHPLPHPPGLFWLKTTVACIGRLGITMSFEMVVFVNTELYPTFVRYGSLHDDTYIPQTFDLVSVISSCLKNALHQSLGHTDLLQCIQTHSSVHTMWWFSRFNHVISRFHERNSSLPSWYFLTKNEPGNR